MGGPSRFRGSLPIFVLAACLATAPPVLAETARGFDPAGLAEFVDGLIIGRLRSHDVAGVTLAVVHQGEVILLRGYGEADVAASRTVDPQRTLFRVGSISKTFVWTAVMQLVEQGRLDLDADIRTWLPNLDLDLRYEEPITLAHLMAHTPGFEETMMGHLFSDDADEVLPLLDYLRRYQPRQVRPPGETPAYSNFGAAVAGLIVANVAGMPFEKYVERHLFEPLGMESSTFREPWGEQRPEAIDPDLRARISNGYRYRDGAAVPGAFEYIGAIGPAGALSATASDMARWMLAHLQQGELDGARILEPRTAARMHQRHAGPDPELPGMAHGFVEGRIHGYRSIGHGGGTVYFSSDLQLVPDLDLGIFISANSSGGFELLRDFPRLLVARYFPRGPDPLPREVLAEPDARRYAGSYIASRRNHSTLERMFATTVIELRAAEPGVLLLSGLGDSERLRKVAPATFRGEESDAVMRFVVDDAGRVLRALDSRMPVMVFDRAAVHQNPRHQLSLLALCALILLCVPFAAWLRRGATTQQTDVERWAGGLAVAVAGGWLLCYVLAVVGLMGVAGNLAHFFYGMPNGWLYAAVAVGLVATLLTVLSALLLYPVWTAGSWPLGRRLRHTAVVLSALLTVLLLQEFNAIGFNLMP